VVTEKGWRCGKGEKGRMVVAVWVWVVVVLDEQQLRPPHAGAAEVKGERHGCVVVAVEEG
jgi:hypothetical protein